MQAKSLHFALNQRARRAVEPSARLLYARSPPAFLLRARPPPAFLLRAPRAYSSGKKTFESPQVPLRNLKSTVENDRVESST